MNIKLAEHYRIPTNQPSSLAGGGTLQASRRRRQQSVPVSRVPAVNFGAHVANWRWVPVFPPTTLAGISPMCLPSPSCAAFGKRR
ncbi:MAG TPA: hypothetical protein PLQ56_15610 [Aggregatilineales bacterium]|nr:hypothetical protein [Aggregatilineales bacterium]